MAAVPNKSVSTSAKSTEPSSKVSRPKTHRTKKLTSRELISLVVLVIWTMAALVISQFLVAYPMYWLLGDAVTTPFWTLVFYILNYGLSLVLVLVLPGRLFQLAGSRQVKPKTASVDEKLFVPDKKSLGVAVWPTFIDIGLAPIGYFAYLILASMATNFLRIFPWFNADQAQEVGFSYFITSFDRFFAMLAVVFIAPIAEEIIMRGWLYGKLRQRLNVWLSILLTSLIFALLHGQLNVGVSVFMLSVVLCSLREITGSIWSGMFLHILSNGIAFYMLYVAAGL